MIDLMPPAAIVPVPVALLVFSEASESVWIGWSTNCASLADKIEAETALECLADLPKLADEFGPEGLLQFVTNNFSGVLTARPSQALAQISPEMAANELKKQLSGSSTLVRVTREHS